MKIKDEINRLQTLVEPTVSISKRRFAAECKEYCYLYKNVYNTMQNPNMKLISVYGEHKVYLERLNYIDMLKDLALLRYKFSRRKFRGYTKNA